MSLSTFISHRVSVPLGADPKVALGAMRKDRVRYAAVLDGLKVVGLCAAEALETRVPVDAKVEEYLLTEPVLVRTDTASTEVVDRVLSRPSEHAGEDIVLLDETDEFLGLIAVADLLRMQKAYYERNLDAMLDAYGQKHVPLVDYKEKFKDAEYPEGDDTSLINHLREARESFIGQLGHETLTPMTGILGMLRLLGESELDGTQRQMIHSAAISAQSLSRLVRNVIDYSRIEANTFTEEEERFTPVKLVQACVNAIQNEVPHRKLSLVGIREDSFTTVVWGDAQRFGLVVQNVLAGAADQTVQGDLQIQFQGIDTADRTLLQLTVSHTRPDGSAVSGPKAPVRINGKPALDMSEGLNLRISKRVAAELGGSVNIDIEDATTRFRIEIPFLLCPQALNRAGSDAWQPSLKPAGPMDKGAPLQILVADDNRVNLQVAKGFLGAYNCKLHLAADGQQALKILRDYPIDGILLDCQMVDLSGYEVCQKIRAGECGRLKSEVFISAMTAHVSDLSKEQCFDSGMDMFIAKPVTRQSFDSFIERCHLRKSGGFESQPLPMKS